MREIIFRGKRKDNGEWVEGSLILTTSTMEKPFIVDSCWCYSGSVDDEGYAKFEYLNAFEVIPETVGQYTGLTDKNGKKIFEGDIVKITDTNVDLETFAFIEFGNPNGLYNWGWQLVPLKKIPFAVEILHWVEMEETGAFIEVIGNIHDNSNC